MASKYISDDISCACEIVKAAVTSEGAGKVALYEPERVATLIETVAERCRQLRSGEN